MGALFIELEGLVLSFKVILWLEKILSFHFMFLGWVMKRHLKINMSFSGDSVFFIRVEVEFRDTIGERVYNLTKLEFEDSTSAIKNLIFEEEDTYWWIPFDKDYDVEQITITYYSYECCGNCGQYGECDWRPATPRCSECKCQNGIYSPCIAARHPVGVSLTEGSTGGGIIIQASVLIEY